jgi:hypothetical protein
LRQGRGAAAPRSYADRARQFFNPRRGSRAKGRRALPERGSHGHPPHGCSCRDSPRSAG